MKIGIICPTYHLGSFAKRSNYHLVLAHMVEKDLRYRNFYREMSKRGDYITLDNSSYELGDDIYTPQQLINLALEVGASEVMAPETYCDADATIEKVCTFIDVFSSVKNKGNLKVFATVHGETLMDVHRCVETVIKEGVSVIGFSCRLDYPIPGYSRYDLPGMESWNRSVVRLHTVFSLRKLMEKYRDRNIEYHLLGINHPMEIAYYDTIGFGNTIRSVDSSCPYLNGVEGVRISDAPYVKPRYKIDFEDEEELHFEATKLIHDNIHILKVYAGRA